MEGDGPGFTFPPEFNKGPESTDISWGDMFLDGIHSDDPNSSDAGVIGTDGASIGNAIHGTAQMVQQQTNVIGGQLQVHIPTHFQGSLGNNTVQQVSSGTVTYLAPSGTAHVSTAGRLQNVLPTTGQQVTAPVGQAQNNAKLVQIAPSFPMASVQQLNSVPIQTLLQSNQTLTGQTIYGSQGTSMFPAQGSVHIENPKVVNVNFGPHVIGSDGSGQQAIIQTAEGKRVLITNSQLQHMPQYFAPQSISLSQLPVGAHLINSGTGNVIRASMGPGTTQARQIVLPTGQTVIPRQANAQQAGLTKNVVLNHHGMSPLIYQSGQSGQIIQSHPTLITSSGAGLQVVNTGGNQGNQVQLIAQPSLNQSGMGQQINQNTIMNFINNQSVIPNAGGQITGLVPGQNIFVNGQMLNIGQLGGLTMSQLQVQPNSQGGVTLANLNAGVARQFQPTTQHLLIQPNGQQQIMLQQKNTSSPSLITTTAQRLHSNIQGGKIARTPTPNANSASSTPVATPTPSTPTPTPTPDLMSECTGQGSKISSIIEQALEMSDIDLQSFEDDFFENTPASLPQTELPPPVVKTKPQPPVKTKSKASKAKSKPSQPLVTVTVPNSTISFQNPKAIFQNAQGQKVTISQDQQIITAGQVYVLSANGQQLILQPSVAQQVKPAGIPTSTYNNAISNVSISSNSQKQSSANQSNISAGVGGQIRFNQGIPVQFNQNNRVLTSPKQDSNKMFHLTHQEDSGILISTVQTPSVSSSHLVYSRPSSYTFTTTNTSQSGSNQVQLKNQKITTLSGTFIKQEPCVPSVKQEPFVDPMKQEPETGVPQALAQQVQYSPIAVTTSNMTPALPVGLASMSPLADPSTTQAHQATIMTSSHLSSPQQAPLQVPTSVQLPRPSSVSCETSTVFSQALSSPTFSTSSKTNSASKERDPNSVKVMTPIKIANSTLMLSLTPLQKQRLEDHLSSMTMKEQNDFLVHQQNIIRRSQQVQQKQLEQQQKYQLQQQKQQLQQQQQIQQQLPPQQSQHQSQTSQQQQSLQNMNNSPRLSSTSSEYSLPSSGAALASIPSTVQELMDKPEECQTQSSFPDQQQQQHQQQFRHQIPVSQTSSQPTSIQQMRIVPETPMHTPAQNYTFQPMGRCLAEQQLLRDKTLALNPDVNSPFKSFSDAMRRLVRYHTLQDHKPEEDSKQMRKWDTRYSIFCDYLVKKKRRYMKRFNKMKLYYDMCPEKSPEYIQNLYCFNEQLQELLNREKEEAKNSPDTFEPLRPDLQSQSSKFHPPVAASKLSDLEHEAIAESKFNVETKEEKKFDVKLEHPELEVKAERSDSPYSSPSGQKRKLPEKSTGTLKFVFKRRTTDNFIVKNSLAHQDGLSQDFKPVVNLEKSDSEYEFDSAVSNKQSVIVRRRASSISMTSRQTSFEANSEGSSSDSPSNDEVESNEDEEDEEEKNTDDAGPSGSEDDVEDEEDIGSQEEKSRSKASYRVSFGASIEERSIGGCNTNNHDVLMESFESRTSRKYKHGFSIPRSNTFGHTGDKTSGPNKSSQASSRNVSYSNTNCGLGNTNYSIEKRVRSNQFTYSASEAQSAFQQSALHVSPPRRKECVAGSPSPNMEKGHERGMPIFTTPNKNLLRTDAMFNFSEDEDDEGGNSRRISSFEIDNKDPQNSMMNDSVRSAINSVLNDGDNEDSQTSWSSSAHRTPSSIHHSLFQSSSPAIVQSHDADLDTAVQSIMND